MKTFSEAYDVVIQSALEDVGLSKKQLKKFKEYGEKVEELGTEIYDSEPTRELLAQMLIDEPIHRAMLNAFVNGVMIGMEMERSENGGVSAE